MEWEQVDGPACVVSDKVVVWASPLAHSQPEGPIGIVPNSILKKCSSSSSSSYVNMAGAEEVLAAALKKADHPCIIAAAERIKSHLEMLKIQQIKGELDRYRIQRIRSEWDSRDLPTAAALKAEELIGRRKAAMAIANKIAALVVEEEEEESIPNEEDALGMTADDDDIEAAARPRQRRQQQQQQQKRRRSSRLATTGLGSQFTGAGRRFSLRIAAKRRST